MTIFDTIDAAAEAARAILEHGDFSGLGGGPPLNDWFTD